MGEAFFYQRNYAAAAQSFRERAGRPKIPPCPHAGRKCGRTFSLGRIYDIQGDRTRAVNEYSKAKQTSDDTGGAQAEIEKSMKKALSFGNGVLKFQ